MNSKVTNQKKNVSGVSEKKLVYLNNNIIETQNDKWRHSNKDFCVKMPKNILFSCTPCIYNKLPSLTAFSEHWN